MKPVFSGRQFRALLLPITVDGVVPALILYTNQPVLAWPLPLRLGLAGLLSIGGGLWLLAQTIRLLIVEGQGTLAPWDPTRRLVVVGIYRRVRNTMITGVIVLLLGEAAVFASPALLLWCLVAALINAVYIPLLEEPGLAERFGADYEVYRRNVPLMRST